MATDDLNIPKFLDRRPKAKAKQPKSWRDVLPIHPAADLFPMMSPDELKALGEDIEKNGLQAPIILFKEQSHVEPVLLDGRNRLAAMELAGFTFQVERDGARDETRVMARRSGQKQWAPILTEEVDGDPRYYPKDPYAFVISANIHRRHLNAVQKRDLIGKLLKATPEKSNRTIAEQVKADDKTVAAVRSKLEATAEIPQLETTVGKDGRTRKKGAAIPGFRELFRTTKLGEETVARIKGTSLDRADEMDELVILNRGAPEGGHTEIVKRLVADACEGKPVSAIGGRNNRKAKHCAGRKSPAHNTDVGSNDPDVDPVDQILQSILALSPDQQRRLLTQLKERLPNLAVKEISRQERASSREVSE